MISDLVRILYSFLVFTLILLTSLRRWKVCHATQKNWIECFTRALTVEMKVAAKEGTNVSKIQK